MTRSLGLLSVVLILSLISASAHAAPLQTQAAGQFFDHLVVLVMENHVLADINVSSAPYQTSLAKNESQALAYGYCSTSGSLPNYLCLTSGQTLVGTCDSIPLVCGTFNARNLVDLLTGAGLTWKGYMEGMNSTNICNGLGARDGGVDYIAHHDPFVYYNDIINNSTRCQQVVRAGDYGGIQACNETLHSNVASTMVTDLQNPSTVPDFMWLTPNNNDNTHACPVSIGNTYLRTIVPQILTSATFTQTRSTLFIVYDEGHDVSVKEHLYAVLSGPEARPGYNSTTPFGHYSWLHTIEANWGLPPMTANDTSAPIMSEFFNGGTVGGYTIPIDEVPLLTRSLTATSIITASVLAGSYLARKAWKARNGKAR